MDSFLLKSQDRVREKARSFFGKHEKHHCIVIDVASETLLLKNIPNVCVCVCMQLSSSQEVNTQISLNLSYIIIM